MLAAIVLLIGATSKDKSENECKHILCSNIFDPVCGEVLTSDSTRVRKEYQNICLMKKTACKMRIDIWEVSGELCNIERDPVSNENGRRINDFSIVGAHQTCNHTCPTYCVDTYAPACAQIWKPGGKSFTNRPMINHCHIDLFSCTVGVNVTIQPLSRCYENASGLLFMSQIAALNSLYLLEDKQQVVTVKKFPEPITKITRRLNNDYFNNMINEFRENKMFV